MIRTKMCPNCGAGPSQGFNRVYCSFCQQRYQRIRQMYCRAGKKFRLYQMHRAWNYWRTSPALDAMYPDLPESDEVAA